MQNDRNTFLLYCSITFVILCITVGFSQEISTPFDDVSSSKKPHEVEKLTPINDVLPEIASEEVDKSILIYFNSTDVYGERYFKKLVSFIREEGFQVATNDPSDGEILQDSLLEKFSQFWIISGDYNNNVSLHYIEKDFIKKIVNGGKGLVIWTDDSKRFQNDANIIGQILGIKFNGCVNNSNNDYIVFREDFINKNCQILKDITCAMFSESDGYIENSSSILPVFCLWNQQKTEKIITSCILNDKDKRAYFDANILRIRDDFFDLNENNKRFIYNLVTWLDKDEIPSECEITDSDTDDKEENLLQFRRLIDFKPPEIEMSSYIFNDSLFINWNSIDIDLKDTAFVLQIICKDSSHTFRLREDCREFKCLIPHAGKIEIILETYDVFGNSSVDSLSIQKKNKKYKAKKIKSTQESCTILLYANSTDSDEFNSLKDYLQHLGNSVDLYCRSDIEEITSTSIEDYSQFWYFCSNPEDELNLSSSEREAILDYIDDGNGFALISRDSLFSRDFNYISNSFDVDIYGSSDHTNSGVETECIDDVHFFSHPIVTGIEELAVTNADGILHSSSSHTMPLSVVNERTHPDRWNITQLTYSDSDIKIYFDSSINKFRNDFFYLCESNPFLSKKISCWLEPYGCSCSESYASIGFLEAFQSTSCDSAGFVTICFQVLDEDASIALEATTDGGLSWTNMGDGFFLHVFDSTILSSRVSPGEYCLKWDVLSDFDSIYFESLGFRLHIEDALIPEFETHFLEYDMYPPIIDINCIDSLFVNSLRSFYWSIDEENLSSDDVYIYLSGCGIYEEHHVAGSFWGYIPDRTCEACTLIVEVNDLFCNTGRDTCVFQIFDEILKGIDTLWMSEELYCDSLNIVEICYNLTGTVASIDIELGDSSIGEEYFVGDGWFSTVYDTAGDIGDGILPGLHCFYWDFLSDFPEIESRDWTLDIHFGYKIDTFVIIDSLDISYREDFGQGLAYDGRFYWIYDAETGWVYKTTCMTCMPRDSFEIGTYHNSDIDYYDNFIYYGRDSSYCRYIWRKNVLFDYDEHVLTIDFDSTDTHYPTVQGVHVLNDSMYVSWYGRSNMMLIRCDLAHSFPITEWDTLFNNPVTAGDSCVRFEGLAESEDYLWGCNNQGRIIQMDLDIPSIIGCYPAPNIDVGAGGLCCDGDYIWYQNDLLQRIYKIQLKDSLNIDYTINSSLDNFAPRLELTCPEDSIYPGDTIGISFSAEDIFYYTDRCTCYVEYCGYIDTIYTEDFDFSWISPNDYSYLRCDSVHFSLRVRDSFCNISNADCALYIIPPCSTWVDSVRFWEETDCDSQNIVEICYNLKSTCEAPYTFVQARMSSDNGSSWDIEFRRFSESSRDLYSNVLPGTHCWLWNFGLDNPGIEDSTFLLEIGLMDSTFSFFIQSDSCNGILDSKKPEYSLYTNPQPVHPLETRTVLIRNYYDMYYPNDIIGDITLFACDSVIDFSVLDSIMEFSIPYIHCPDAFFVVEIRDSFCNTFIDTIELVITNLAPIILTCPFETLFAPVFDTSYVSLDIVDEIGLYEESDYELLEIIAPDEIDYFFVPGSLSIMSEESGIFEITLIAYDILGASDTCIFEFNTFLDSECQFIKEGWNLLSAPLRDTICADSLYPFSIPPIWQYSTDELSYSTLDSVYCGKGYWLLSDTDLMRTFDGYTLCSDLDIELLPGWNLIGVPDIIIPIADVFDYPEIITPVYFFNFETFGYETTDSLRKYYGYWIFSTDTLYISIP